MGDLAEDVRVAYCVYQREYPRSLYLPWFCIVKMLIDPTRDLIP
jgi:hypothetical protein